MKLNMMDTINANGVRDKIKDKPLSLSSLDVVKGH
jgi:hypothetical protein